MNDLFDLLILLAVALWIGLGVARESGWCGVRRGQASAAARRNQRRLRSESAAQGRPVVGPSVNACQRP